MPGRTLPCLWVVPYARQNPPMLVGGALRRLEPSITGCWRDPQVKPPVRIQVLPLVLLEIYGEGRMVCTTMQPFHCYFHICITVFTCDDGIKNGDEVAVDCGGSCSDCSMLHCPVGQEVTSLAQALFVRN